MSNFNVNHPPGGPYNPQTLYGWLVQGIQSTWRRVNGIGNSGSGGSENATSIQSIPISASAPAGEQYLKFDGTDWKPGNIAVGDAITGGTPQTIVVVSITGQLADVGGNIGDTLQIGTDGNPSFTSDPVATTQAASENSTKIATTAFVQNQLAGLGNTAGLATLATGRTTVSTSSIKAGDRVFVSLNTAIGSTSAYGVPATTIVDGISFNINAYIANSLTINTIDASTVNWMIIHS